MEEIMNTPAGRLALHAASTALTRAQARASLAEEELRHDFERLHEAQESFMGIIPWIKRILYWMVVGQALLLVSIASYGIFYLIVMPGNHATEQLYFDYTCKAPSVCEVNEGWCTEATSHEKCSPVATVDLFARHTTWEAFQEGVVPQPITYKRILKSKQHYLMEIALSLPESSTNVQAGMFGVAVNLQSSNGTSLASSVRSARLPHESTWVGVVRKSVSILALLLGALTESRTIIIPSFRHYVESREHPLRYVTVRLLARGSEWQDTPVEVVWGELRIGKELNPFQGVMKEWFFMCYAVGTLTFFTIYIVAFLVARIWVREQRHRRAEERAAHLDDDDDVAWGEAHDYTDPWDNVPGDDADEWDDIHEREGDQPTSPNVVDDEQEDAPHESTRVGSSPAVETVADEPQTSQQREDDLRDRVMRGHTEPHVVFTDHDDPDLFETIPR